MENKPLLESCPWACAGETGGFSHPVLIMGRPRKPIPHLGGRDKRHKENQVHAANLRRAEAQRESEVAGAAEE